MFGWICGRLFGMKRALGFLLGFLCAVFSVNADDERSLVRFVPFALNNINPADGKLIESLILSYVSQMDGISVYVDPEFIVEETEIPALTDADEPDTVTNIPDSPDYSVRLIKNDDVPLFVFTGSISREDERYVLVLDLDNLESHENTRQTLFYKTTSEMALKARSIVEDYFQKTKKPEAEDDENPILMMFTEMSGTWHGSDGIELLRFSNTGNAMVYFTSGGSMELKWKIEDNAMNLVQVSPNNFRYYYPLPSDAAQKLAALAEPMQWKMYLYKNGRVLRGICVSTIAESDGNGDIKNVIYGSIKRTEWTKLGF
jgi:hypothetical protein